jgi:catechol 2,3-dioxygenase-like lactoylglutathione lyase family enzyme
MLSPPAKNSSALSSRAKRGICFCGILSWLLLPTSISAQNPPARPAITNIVFVRVKASSIEKAEHFYGDLLGLPRLDPGCFSLGAQCFVIGPRQWLEIKQATVSPTEDLVDAIGMLTSDTSTLRHYLISRGLQPGSMKPGRSFEISDPEGHRIVFVSIRRLTLGGKAQQSGRLIHAGFVVRDRVAMDKFYKDILGFRPYWHGGMKDDKDDWVAMQVPDGTGWVEYMLNISPTADKHTLGVMNHIALGVPDIQAAKAQLIKNGWKPGEEPKLGRDGKWQLNLYDPDDTRIEFMEFTPKEKPCCSEFTGPHPGPKQ